MTEATRDSLPFDDGPFITTLNTAEQETWAVSRKVAFGVLAGLSVIACVGAVYWWYLRALTAQSCVETYIQESTTPRLLSGEQDVGFQERFIALDISSFSALILALLFTRLAYVGSRNTIRYYMRDRESYFRRAYHAALFTEGFESLCIRLGLLGTLLSFSLAAISQMGGTSTSTVAPPPSATTLESRVAEIVGESTDGSSSSLAATDSERVSGATSQLSENMFLLLCASLVSTFVGTGVAYVVSPALNWLNDRAVGRHQTVQIDTQAVAEEFFLQVDRTSRRLAEFETTSATLFEAVNHICSFEANVGLTAETLTKLVAGLESGVQVFEGFDGNAKKLAKKLERLESMSDRLTALLDRIPERLSDPLANISLTARNFREAALSGEAAFRELKSVAGAANASLGATEKRTQTSWQMIRELQDGLRELSENEQVQTAEVVKLVQSFDGIGDSLKGLVGQLDLLGQQLRHNAGVDGEQARLETTHRSTRNDPHAGSPMTTVERSMPTERGAQMTGRLQPTRSWWQRLFG